MLTLTTRDDGGAPLSISRWKKKPVDRGGEAVRTAKILMTVLLLGAPTWVGAQAARPTTGAPEVFSATAQAKNATGAVSGTLEVRVSSLHAGLRSQDRGGRRSGWVATRGFSRPFATRPRSGSSSSAAASRTRSGMRARRSRRAAGRSSWSPTSPCSFSAAARADAKPRAGYEVAVLQIQLDGAGRGNGTMAGAARVRPDGDGGVLLDDYAEEPIELTNITRKPG